MIRDFLRRVFALVKKEFITIWKDPKSRGIITRFHFCSFLFLQMPLQWK